MPQPDDFHAAIREVLQAHGKLASDALSLPADASLYDAGMNSHASVNVMLALEARFDTEFPDEMLTRQTFQSIAQIAQALAQLGAG